MGTNGKKSANFYSYLIIIAFKKARMGRKIENEKVHSFRILHSETFMTMVE